MSDRNLDRITSADVWNFAVGIVERFREAKPEESTDEARMLYALARDYLRKVDPPRAALSPSGKGRG